MSDQPERLPSPESAPFAFCRECYCHLSGGARICPDCEAEKAELPA